MKTLKEELESDNYGLYSVCGWLVEYHSGLIPPDYEFKREEVLEHLYNKFFPIRKTTLEKIYDLWNEPNGFGVEEMKDILLREN